MCVGFSTGSLARGDVRLGLQMVAESKADAVELSALREEELVPLIDSLDSLDLSQFSYVSFHAPSCLNVMTEARVVSLLRGVADRGWPVIVHPDVITDVVLWRVLGEFLCIENMDKRKRTGRTAAELQEVFSHFPDAQLCFDIGHARQIDPTMGEAGSILHAFKGRIRQVHLSFVTSGSAHERLNYESMLAYKRVARLVPNDVPIILETPVACDEVNDEISKAETLAASFAQL
jgi:hypothetical protein